MSKVISSQMFADVRFFFYFASTLFMILIDIVYGVNSQVDFGRGIAFDIDGVETRAWEGLLPNNRILIYCL